VAQDREIFRAVILCNFTRLPGDADAVVLPPVGTLSAPRNAAGKAAMLARGFAAPTSQDRCGVCLLLPEGLVKGRDNRPDQVIERGALLGRDYRGGVLFPAVLAAVTLSPDPRKAHRCHSWR
jgi:hypothetical protein